MPILARARTMPTVRTISPKRHFWAAKTCSTRDRTRARVALPRTGKSRPKPSLTVLHGRRHSYLWRPCRARPGSASDGSDGQARDLADAQARPVGCRQRRPVAQAGYRLKNCTISSALSTTGSFCGSRAATMRSRASVQPKVTPQGAHGLIDVRPRTLLRDQVELVRPEPPPDRAGPASGRNAGLNLATA